MSVVWLHVGQGVIYSGDTRYGRTRQGQRKPGASWIMCEFVLLVRATTLLFKQ